MIVELFGAELPGRRCGPERDGTWHDNIHVGVRCRKDAIDLVAGDAPSAHWRFEVDERVDKDGRDDVGGPFVHGKRGERCMYLQWGDVDDTGEFAMFRAAKLMFEDIDDSLLRAARDGARLVGRLGLSDPQGWPICARVRPPVITWTTEPPR